MKVPFTLFSVLFVAACVAQQLPPSVDTPSKTNTSDTSYIKFDDTRKTNWPRKFQVIDIQSSQDGLLQKAYFYKSGSSAQQPLIVSLHTWSGNYSQKDDIAALCLKKDLNYIHPNFRGENKTASACCSDLALSDIDDAIAYAIRFANVDTNRIYVIGVSGGGYATLSAFMKSRRRIKKFSAWASITDLEAWYHESIILKNKYAVDIFACTDSKMELNIPNARQKSPLYMKTPVEKLKNAKLFIYAGIYDGLQGSVPITHSINFYNKLLIDLAEKDKSKFVSDKEKLQLLEFRRPLGKLGMIANRKICLQKRSSNISITIFEGDHEMLTQYALDEILKD